MSELNIAVKKLIVEPSSFEIVTSGLPQKFSGGPEYEKEAIVADVGGFLTS